MRTVVSAKEMRWCDEETINEYGVSGLVLMENAGRSVADRARAILGTSGDRRVLIFCGKGNNGGDGFVTGRYLVNAGIPVTVVSLTPQRQLTGDARTNFLILRKLQRSAADLLTLVQYSPQLLSRLPSPSLIIDALFGTGFTGAVRPPVLGVIRWINRQKAPVIAVDIPSGVDGTTGVAVSSAVKASMTVTFGALKTGLLCNEGQDLTGEISITDIGIPPAVLRSKQLKTFLVEQEDLLACLPARPSTAHKYSVGKVFVLAGSKGYTGAAYLCALAAMRAGAGAVMLGIPEMVYPILAKKLSEVVVRPLASTSDGTLAMAALDEVRERIAWANVLVIGPGLSTQPETQDAIRAILSSFNGKAVVDADALRIIGEMGLTKLKRSKGTYILTPHTGEYSRVIGLPSAAIDVDRIEMARRGAVESGSTIILKGAPTAIGSSNGNVYVNPTGNPGMATVGSGDVLAGIIASFWAQGMSPDAAAYAGVYVHGLSGDCAKEKYGERSLLAEDLITDLPTALKRIGVR